jgi:hypothetical protein
MKIKEIKKNFVAMMNRLKQLHSEWQSKYYTDYYRIYDFVEKLKTPYYEVRHFFRWIVKSCRYAKLLWRDRDWDWIFLLILMKYKIQRMRLHMTEHNIIHDAPRMAKQMRYAEFLIERILDDDYCKKEYEDHRKYWGELEHLFEEPADPALKGKGYSIWNPKAKNAKTQKDQEREREEIIRIHKKADKLREDDMDRLFSHLRKYIQRWWD